MNSKMISVKSPFEDLKLIEKAAQMDRRSKSSFYHLAALERAYRILEEKTDEA